ncbi:protein KlaA [Acidovorax sp.]|uniref:protein KlaA n=1 Tax=Acidovorax sp. TaxID=1872122 RepID=UPI00391F5BBA
MTIEHLKTTLIPALFADTARISEYGNSQSGSDAVKAVSDIMELGPVGALATCIREILATLKDADPRTVSKQPTWLDTLLGRSIEWQVRYQVARKSLDDQLAHAEGVAQLVQDALARIAMLQTTHAAESLRLTEHIAAGRQFLDENPLAGVVDNATLQFDNPRERFARKLANLATLLSSHEMSAMQLSLTRAQAVDILDRFRETASTLIPVWRQHTLSLTNNKNMSPEMLALATKAHTDLMKSLTISVDGLASK